MPLLAGGAAITCVFVVDTTQEMQRPAAIRIRPTKSDIWRLENGFIMADPFCIPRTEKMPTRQLAIPFRRQRFDVVPFGPRRAAIRPELQDPRSEKSDQRF